MIDFISPQAVERAARSRRNTNIKAGRFDFGLICGSVKLLLGPEEEARRIKGEKDSLAKKRKEI